MSNKMILFSVAILLLAGGTLALVTGAAIARKGLFAPAEPKKTEDAADLYFKNPPPGSQEPWLKEFTLVDHTGQPVGSEDLQGKVWIASFFFASCPTICRLQNGEVNKLVEELGPQGVIFMNITCDPETDRVENLKNYAAQFDQPAKSWHFLTGPLPYIRRIGAEFFGVAVDKQTHTERLIVVDRWGKVRNAFHWNDPTELEKLKTAVNELLEETSPPKEENSQEIPAEPSVEARD